MSNFMTCDLCGELVRKDGLHDHAVARHHDDPCPPSFSSRDGAHNENCLQGMECPECGSLGEFLIHAECVASVDDDGVEAATDYEWDYEARCTCLSCRFRGIVKDFWIDK